MKEDDFDDDEEDMPSAPATYAEKKAARNRAKTVATAEDDGSCISAPQANWLTSAFAFRFKIAPGTKWNDVQSTLAVNLTNSQDCKNVLACIKCFHDLVHTFRKKEYPKKGQGLPRHGTAKAALVVDIIRKGKWNINIDSESESDNEITLNAPWYNHTPRNRLIIGGLCALTCLSRISLISNTPQQQSGVVGRYLEASKAYLGYNYWYKSELSTLTSISENLPSITDVHTWTQTLMAPTSILRLLNS